MSAKYYANEDRFITKSHDVAVCPSPV